MTLKGTRVWGAHKTQVHISIKHLRDVNIILLLYLFCLYKFDFMIYSNLALNNWIDQHSNHLKKSPSFQTILGICQLSTRQAML
jgi:hypothetical protein